MFEQDFYRIENARHHLRQAEAELRAVFRRNPDLKEAYERTLAALSHIRDEQHDDDLHNANVLSLDHLRDDIVF